MRSFRRDVRRFLLIFALVQGLLLIAIGGTTAGPEQFSASRHTLTNGLTVLVSEDHALPVACFCIFFKVGSRNEAPGITGISHLLEHLRFSCGTERFAPREFDRIIEAAGGYSNGGTTKDYTLYWEEFVSSALEKVLELEADRMRGLKIEPEIFSREVQVVIEERLMGSDNDIFGTMSEQLFANTYLAHPYRWPVIGWMGDLKALSLEEVKAYITSHYAPNNAVAVLVGDVNEAESLALIEKYFSDIPAQAPPRPVVDAEPPQRGERRVWVKKEAELPAAMIAYWGPPIKGEDLHPLSLLENILSEGESSRIYRQLIYEQQIAASAWANLFDTIDPGRFCFYIQMKPGRETKEGEEALGRILSEIQETGVSPEELQKAKNMAQAAFIQSLEGNASRARMLGYYEVLFGNYQELSRILGKLNKVTAADVQRVARIYFDPDRRTTLTLVPVKGAK